MQRSLGTLPVGLELALLLILGACLWSLWALRGRGLSAYLKARHLLLGLLSLGLKPSAEPDEPTPPDLMFPSLACLFGLWILISGSRAQVPLFGYGLSLMVGFIAAIAVASARAKRRGVDPNHIIDIGMLAVAFGLIGARLFHVLQFYHERFADKPLWTMLAIWQGGMVFYGGLIVAAVAGVLYCRWRGHRVLRVADIVAPSLALGLAFGRLGCFLNGCCWGRVCSPETPFAVQFPRESLAWWRHVKPYLDELTLTAFDEGAATRNELLNALPDRLQDWSHFVYPIQLYSFAAAMALMLFLLLAERLWLRREGQSFALFFVLYAVARFSLEVFRGDHPVVFDLEAGVLTPGQELSVVILPLGLLAFMWVSLKGEPIADAQR